MSGILKNWHLLEQDRMDPKPLTAFETTIRPAGWDSYKAKVVVQQINKTVYYTLTLNPHSAMPKEVVFTSDETAAVISLLSRAREVALSRVEVGS